MRRPKVVYAGNARLRRGEEEEEEEKISDCHF